MFINYLITKCKTKKTYQVKVKENIIENASQISISHVDTSKFKMETEFSNVQTEGRVSNLKPSVLPSSNELRIPRKIQFSLTLQIGTRIEANIMAKERLKCKLILSDIDM